MKTESLVCGLTPEAIEELKRKYPSVHMLCADPDGEARLEIIVRKPGRADYSRFLKDAPKNTYAAMRQMVMDCRLAPDPDAVAAMFEENPGLVTTFGDKVAALAKGGIECTEKKL